MRSCASAHHRPTTLAGATALLAALGDGAQPTAGGHGLGQASRGGRTGPVDLVDLAAIEELHGIRRDGLDIVIGAMVTLREMSASDLLRRKLPILVEAVLTIGDPQVRGVGTVGGNVAGGDPANDLPAVLLALGATYRLAGPRGERSVAARDFYKAPFYTALEPGEILTAIRIAAPPAGHGWCYGKEQAIDRGAIPIAAAVLLTMDSGVVDSCSIALTNLARPPVRAPEAMRLVTGSRLDGATLRRAAAAVEEIIPPSLDSRGLAVDRAVAMYGLLRRVLARAGARVEGFVRVEETQPQVVDFAVWWINRPVRLATLPVSEVAEYARIAE